MLRKIRQAGRIFVLSIIMKLTAENYEIGYLKWQYTSIKRTYVISNIWSSPSPRISLVPKMWLRSMVPPILFGVLPGWTGVFKPLRLPPLYVDGGFWWHVASPTTKIPLSTANTGPTAMSLWAAANKWRSQLSLMLKTGPGVVIGFGDVLTEYRPGCGISIVLNNLKKYVIWKSQFAKIKKLIFYLNRRWQESLAPASASGVISRPPLQAFTRAGNATWNTNFSSVKQWRAANGNQRIA